MDADGWMVYRMKETRSPSLQYSTTEDEDELKRNELIFLYSFFIKKQKKTIQMNRIGSSMVEVMGKTEHCEAIYKKELSEKSEL